MGRVICKHSVLLAILSSFGLNLGRNMVASSRVTAMRHGVAICNVLKTG